MSRAPPQTGSRKISFNVSEQYDIQDVVGEGAYGVVWSVAFLDLAEPMLSLPQLRTTQAFESESSHQENHTFRPLHVLSTDSAGNEASAILQPRKHHFYS